MDRGGAKEVSPPGRRGQEEGVELVLAEQGCQYQCHCWQRPQGYGGCAEVSYVRPEAEVKMVWPEGRTDKEPWRMVEEGSERPGGTRLAAMACPVAGEAAVKTIALGG